MADYNHHHHLDHRSRKYDEYGNMAAGSGHMSGHMAANHVSGHMANMAPSHMTAGTAGSRYGRSNMYR